MSTESTIENKTFFNSWSGGKDACLALYGAMREGGVPRALVTMQYEDDGASRGHRLPVGLIMEQASSLGIPLITRQTSWEGYEQALLTILEGLREEGVEAGVFGDIELEEHREWVSRVCSSAGMEACLPLWGKTRNDLIDELLGAGFEATIVAVREGSLDGKYLGKTLDEALVGEFIEMGIDICGEEGEYHTVVTDGPIFSSPIVLKKKGKFYRDGHWYLDLNRSLRVSAFLSEETAA